VSNVTTTGATLSATTGSLFLGGSERYSFGLSTAYGQSTASVELPASAGTQPAPAMLSGLTPATTYHVQLTVTTPDGTASSQDVTFTTAAIPVPVAAIAAISALQVSPRSFSLAGRKQHGRCVTPTRKNRAGPHCRRPIALHVAYALNVAATVTFTVQQKATGRTVGGRCVKSTAKNTKHAKCTRPVDLSGTLVKSGTAGRNQLVFNGKIGRRTIGPGSYTLVATPANGTASVVSFRIVS
jgi:hypothetical protein